MPAGRLTRSFWRNPECIYAPHIDDATVAPVAAPRRRPKAQQMGFMCTSSVSLTYLFSCHPDISVHRRRSTMPASQRRRRSWRIDASQGALWQQRQMFASCACLRAATAAGDTRPGWGRAGSCRISRRRARSQTGQSTPFSGVRGVASRSRQRSCLFVSSPLARISPVPDPLPGCVSMPRGLR